MRTAEEVVLKEFGEDLSGYIYATPSQLEEFYVNTWNEAIEAAKINAKVIVKATLSERGIWKADYIVDFGLLEKLKK
jgi:hypothetical protein